MRGLELGFGGSTYKNPRGLARTSCGDTRCAILPRPVAINMTRQHEAKRRNAEQSKSKSKGKGKAAKAKATQRAKQKQKQKQKAKRKAKQKAEQKAKQKAKQRAKQRWARLGALCLTTAVSLANFAPARNVVTAMGMEPLGWYVYVRAFMFMFLRLVCENCACGV